KYPGSVIQPRCISQDMFKGLFGTIRQLGGDSSTQTLKSYRHSLNKYQVTALVSSKLKSINYGEADGTGIGINTLTRRDYRKDKKCPINNENPHYIYEKHSIQSCNSNVNDENMKAFYLQIERCNLIEAILYQDSIDHLLQKWQNIIRTMVFEAVPKKIGVQCVQVIAQTFKRKTIKIEQNKLSADCHLMIKNIIVLELTEASKFSYIVGWVIYKLIKSDDLTQSHPQFNSIRAHLEVLSSEKLALQLIILRSFNMLLDIASSCQHVMAEKQELKDDLDGAEEVFSRIFLVSELQWLLWVFGDSATKKRKKNLISSILNHLLKGTQF
ncbi:3339_t:CDS:2, partial [Dentiscutata erythropus]